MYIPLTSLKLFACIAKKEKLETLLKYLLDLKNEALANNNWFGTTKKYECALLPNFFILYFGQKPPTGDIMSDELKMAFTTLGKGYKAWCTVAEEVITPSCKIATALNNVAKDQDYDQVTFVQKYFNKNWTGPSQNCKMR